MNHVLYLFPDTNLFLQCRALNELDWSRWRNFDEVNLMVSLPVQREIDNHKKKGNSRLGRRGRETNTLFRKIIGGETKANVVRVSDPCVKLFIAAEYSPDPALVERLNYEERDDQLIGTIYTFLKQHPEADARLLTDDTTPIATAISLGIAVVEIPEAWLLPPESTESEKKISALENELSRLKKAEPQFKIDCLNAAGEKVEKLEYTLQRFEALTEVQIASLMKRITDRFPLETDFGPREAATRQRYPALTSFFAIKEVYVPATGEEIAAYREKQYPRWQKECENTLRNYHDTLNRQTGQPAFCFVAVNEGTRPGNDALVVIKATGNFAIMPPRMTNADDEDEEGAAGQSQEGPIELPQPPAPPHGKWQAQELNAFTAALRSLHAFPELHTYDGLGIRDVYSMPDLSGPFRRDPNSFYYKNERPKTPQPSFSLECAQWRHVGGEERFSGEIYFAADQDKVAGALECEIHAENLSYVASLQIPVRIIIASTSVFQRAGGLVDALTGVHPTQPV